MDVGRWSTAASALGARLRGDGAWDKAASRVSQMATSRRALSRAIFRQHRGRRPSRRRSTCRASGRSARPEFERFRSAARPTAEGRPTRPSRRSPSTSTTGARSPRSSPRRPSRALVQRPDPVAVQGRPEDSTAPLQVAVRVCSAIAGPSSGSRRSRSARRPRRHRLPSLGRGRAAGRRSASAAACDAFGETWSPAKPSSCSSRPEARRRTSPTGFATSSSNSTARCSEPPVHLAHLGWPARWLLGAGQLPPPRSQERWRG